MKTARRGAVMLALAASTALLLSSCQGLDDAPSSRTDDDTITVGFVTPLTGSLAAFGAPDTFVAERMQRYFDDNPIQVGDRSYAVNIVIADSQSSATRAGQVAQDLITQQGADVLLAHATPDTTVPVANQCELNAIPCITADTPWQPWFFGRDGDPDQPFKWTYHFFWGLEDVAGVYQDMWSQLDTNGRVAGLFPNDSDGNAWSEALPEMIAENGFELNNPGLFDPGTQDYSAQLASFKNSGDEILMGVVSPPDFASFWQQAQQQGFAPKMVTMAKAVEFPAAIDSLGSDANNIGTEVWWSPMHPYSSSLTGESSAELAEAYEEASGQQWSMVLGFSEALFEVFAQAIIDAGGTDGEAIAEALSTMSVESIVGPLDWNSGPVPNVAKTPLVGGQWRTSDGPHQYELVIVSNSLATDVPVGGEMEPLS